MALILREAELSDGAIQDYRPYFNVTRKRIDIILSQLADEVAKVRKPKA